LLSDADVINIVHEFAGNLVGGSQTVFVDPGEAETVNFGNLFVPPPAPAGLAAASESEQFGDLSTLLAKDVVASTTRTSSFPSLASLFNEPVSYQTTPFEPSPLLAAMTSPATEAPQLLFVMNDALHSADSCAVDEFASAEDRVDISTDDVSEPDVASLDEVFSLLGVGSL
jgi:hypothetical protein